MPLQSVGDVISSFLSRNHIGESSELFIIAAQNNLVCSSDIYSNPVVGEAFSGVEVEYEEKTGTFIYDNLVDFVLKGDIRLRWVF